MNSTMAVGICPSDYSFGPGISNCNRTFDFTLTFEESILSIVPSTILILLAPIRIYFLRGQRRRVAGRRFQLLKVTSVAIFAAIQVTLLVIWCLQSAFQTKVSVAAALMSFLDSLMFCALSYTEHSRSLRPSTLLGVYLFFSLLFDAVRARTLWLLDYDPKIRALFTASVSAKIVLLILEAQEKRKFMSRIDQERGPEETSSIFNQSVFWWLNDLISRGFRSVLRVEDLFPIDGSMQSEHLITRFSQKWESNPGTSKYRLLKVSIKLLKWQILAPVPARVVGISLTFCQPLLLNRFLEFLQNPDESVNTGYGLIAAYGVVYFGLAISDGWYWSRVFRFVTVVRGTYVSAIYRKTTGVSITELDNAAAVTLMSTDIERVQQGFRNLHEIWANLVQVFMATWLLQRELGVACLPPVLIAAASGAGTILMSSATGKRQTKWVETIQKRVGITSTMLGSMKGVKMSGLTQTLATLIQELRITELAAAISFQMISTWTVVAAFFPQQISPVITFAVFVAFGNVSGNSLDTSRMFTSLSLLALLSSPLSSLFQQIPFFISAFSCIDRIQKFLMTSAREDHRVLTYVPPQFPKVMGTKNRSRIPDDIELVDIRPSTRLMTNERFTDVIVVNDGSFGWEKEELPVLQDINLSIQKGKLTILIGPVASGKTTLLKAFLGETPSSKGFVHISTLNFSFCDQSPWLLSQTVQKNIIGFANFDSAWYNSVIHACSLDEDIALFPSGDQTLIGSNGISLSGGQKQRLAIARAVYAKKEVAIFDDVFSGLDASTEKRVFERVFSPSGLLGKLRTTIIIATHAVNHLPSADHIIALGPGGIIMQQGSFDQLNSSDGYVRSLAIRDQHKSAEEEVQDSSTIHKLGLNQSPPLNQSLDDKSRQIGDLTVYRYYFKTLGMPKTVIFLILAISFAFLQTFPNVWVKWWSDDVLSSKPKTGMYLGVYAFLQSISLVVLYCVAVQAFVIMVQVAGKKLHRITLKTVMSAPMSFFSTTDTGVTLNRFSQDIQIIDSELPLALLNVTVLFFLVIGSAILISTSSPYIALTYPGILGLFHVIQKYYLRTSRQLRFMDIEAKSPLYTQFLESLSGLASLRAFGWQEPNQALNASLLNTSQRPYYLLFMIQRWLNLVVDLIGVALALVVVGIAVKTRASASPGFAGVALLNIITFTQSLKNFIVIWTELETSIGAVSRVRAFENETPSEHKTTESNAPPQDWPSHGAVDIRNVSAAYQPAKDTLHDIEISIRPGEKIGICGRSGSGKSSMVLALFRMIELTGGSILIDNVDIATVPREEVRSRLNAIPQDPFFLYGSVRSNLDPWEVHTDDRLENALKRVQLWATVSNRGGLGAEMEVDFLSHGQRQLFCLARAILRPGKIVVLDEATSSVDRKTDKLMQRIIREAFSDYTIIVVAHRLETILDFDRIAVLDKGVLMECDTPKNLLARKSMFRDLYDSYEMKNEGETLAE